MLNCILLKILTKNGWNNFIKLSVWYNRYFSIVELHWTEINVLNLPKIKFWMFLLFITFLWTKKTTKSSSSSHILTLTTFNFDRSFLNFDDASLPSLQKKNCWSKILNYLEKFIKNIFKIIRQIFEFHIGFRNSNATN